MMKTLSQLWAKWRTYYRAMTPAQKAKLWSLILTGLTGFATFGDRIRAVPFLPNWFVVAYPFLVQLDLAFIKLVNIFTNPNAVALPPVGDDVPAK